MANGRKRSRPAKTAVALDSRAKLIATLSAVVLLMVGAVITPLGTKLVNVFWPDPPSAAENASGSSSPTAAAPAAATFAATDGCQNGGAALSVSLSYDFTGSTWWATQDKLPLSVLDQLNAALDSDLSALLAPYQPVEMQYGAGTLLKLTVTGCGSQPVIVSNMYATVSKRAEPLGGGVVFVPPQGDLDVKAVAFDLDRPNRTPALGYDPRTGQVGQPYFTSQAVQVAAGETVPFAIMGLTDRSYVEWSVAIEALLEGQPFQVVVTLAGGHPIRSTTVAATYQSAYILSTRTFRYEQTDPTELAKDLR